MVLYTCERCLREFTKKFSYEKHVKRKFPCRKINSKKNADIATLETLLIEFKNIVERIEKLESCPPKKISNKIKNTDDKYINVNNNINNGTINNNSNNINIHLVAFGKEKMNFVIDDIAKICQGNKTIPNLINYMHFDANKPENHNIYMPNRKNKKEVFVYDGENWMLSDKKEIVEQLIDKGIMYMEGKIDELQNKISESKLNAIQRAIDTYNDIDDEGNKEAVNKITNDIELILYNKKDMVINTKNKKDVAKN